MSLKALALTVFSIFVAVISTGCNRTDTTTKTTPAPVTTPPPAVTITPPATTTTTTTSSTTVGQKVDDAGITVKVKSALIADPDVKALTIDVDTSNAVVTLKGTVASQALADKATQVARGVAGVSSVQSQLTVK